MKLEVIQKLTYTLKVDGELKFFNAFASRLLTNTEKEEYDGIFTTCTHIVCFTRKDAEVIVNFDAIWDIEDYENPALEIKRRVALVNAAFDAVKESYTKSWTVEL